MKLRRALIAVIVACLGCSGCAPARGAARPEEIGDKRVIDFWNGFTGPDGKTMERMVRAFEAENPDLRVRMQIIPWRVYYDKLTLALVYGGAPDLFILHASRIAQFAPYDKLRRVEDLLASGTAPLGEADFAAAPWKASFYEGQQFGLPLDVHPVGLYCNARLLREAGLSKAPATWDEFVEAARRTTKDTDGDGRTDQWGFVFTWQRTNWLTFAAQFGTGILTPDERSCDMASPRNLAALSRMRELIYTHRVAPKPEGVDAWLAFRQGKAAMALEGIYMLSSLEETEGLEFLGAPVPRFGAEPGTFAGSHMLGLPGGASPESSSAAWRLARYLSDHSLEWARGGQVPARSALLRSPEFRAMTVQSQFARQLPYIRYEPLVPKLNGLMQHVDPCVEAVLLGLQTPEDAASDACRRIDQVLRRP